MTPVLDGVNIKTLLFVVIVQSERKVICSNDPDANSWIPKVHPDWMGAIPATIFYSSGYREFHGEMIDYKTLKETIEPRVINK